MVVTSVGIVASPDANKDVFKKLVYMLFDDRLVFTLLAIVDDCAENVFVIVNVPVVRDDVLILFEFILKTAMLPSVE